MINFPNNPSPNDLFTSNGVVYVFDGVKWDAVGSVVNFISSDTGTVFTGFLKGDGFNVFVDSSSYSVVGHVHVSSDVTDFVSATLGVVDKGYVDGLGVDAGFLNGLDSSDFSLVSHVHVEQDITDLDKYDQSVVDAKDAAVEASAVAFAIALG